MKLSKDPNAAELIYFLNKSKGIRKFQKPPKLLGNMKTAKKRVAGHF